MSDRQADGFHARFWLNESSDFVRSLSLLCPLFGDLPPPTPRHATPRPGARRCRRSMNVIFMCRPASQSISTQPHHSGNSSQLQSAPAVLALASRACSGQPGSALQPPSSVRLCLPCPAVPCHDLPFLPFRFLRCPPLASPGQKANIHFKTCLLKVS